MLEVIFVCVIGLTTKEIKIEKNKSCKVFIDDLEVGNAKNSVEFCVVLADKVKQDMEKKGFKCKGV